jgi:hypothetical protein
MSTVSRKERFFSTMKRDERLQVIGRKVPCLPGVGRKGSICTTSREERLPFYYEKEGKIYKSTMTREEKHHVYTVKIGPVI